jgi:hypothetical protein
VEEVEVGGGGGGRHYVGRRRRRRWRSSLRRRRGGAREALLERRFPREGGHPRCVAILGQGEEVTPFLDLRQPTQRSRSRSRLTVTEVLCEVK